MIRVFPWEGETVSVEFTFSFVRGKARPRHMRNGHTYTPHATERDLKVIAEAYEEAANGLEPAPADCPVCVEIVVRKRLQSNAPKCVKARRDYTKPDGDNVAKLVLDALNKKAYDDDKQVIFHSVLKDWRTRRWNNETSVRVSRPKSWSKADNELRDGR